MQVAGPQRIRPPPRARSSRLLTGSDGPGPGRLRPCLPDRRHVPGRDRGHRRCQSPGPVDIRLPPVEVKLPTAADPGEMVATVVRPGKGAGPHPRIALVDVDGVLLNQNYGSLYAVGDNPLASFRDKLDAAARDPQVAAVAAADQQPRRQRHGLRRHGRGAPPVQGRDPQAGRRLPDGPGHLGGLLRRRRGRPDRRPPHRPDRRPGRRLQPLQPPGRDGPAQPRGRPGEVGGQDRHGDRHRPPGRRDPGHDPEDGRRLPRSPPDGASGSAGPP